MGSIDNIIDKLSTSRRSFLKGMTAIAGGAVIGCSSKSATMDASDAITKAELPNQHLNDAVVYTAACSQNCGVGVRCVSKVHVVNGRIVRVTTDDSEKDYKGNLRDRNILNDARYMNCVKGKAQKYRAHHPGRLKYPLKQTKERGDITGFVRVSSEEALEHVAKKYRYFETKYGPNSILDTYATAVARSGTYNNTEISRRALTTFLGGARKRYATYSYHQWYYMQDLVGLPLKSAAEGFRQGKEIYHLAGCSKNAVAFGTNILSTNNSFAWPYIRAMEMLKERGGKVYFLGPEFVDTGVTCATDWVQVRNYTDTALIMAMMYHMIDLTFDKNGNVRKGTGKPQLDLDYLDTFVYGFFDSPGFYLNDKTGEMKFTKPKKMEGHRKVNAVPAGQSLSAYIMGSDDRLTKAKYGTKNYTAKMYTEHGSKTRNLATCSYDVKTGNDTKYLYKKDMNVPKTPEWAEQITGTPADTIRELAELYLNPANHPIYTEWSGGLQKQDAGTIALYALQSMLAVSKTFGLNGEAILQVWGSRFDRKYEKTDDSLYLSPPAKFETTLAKVDKKIPIQSVKDWYNGIRYAYNDDIVKNFKDQTGKKVPGNYYLPDWDMQDPFLHDDACAKAGATYDYEGGVDGFPAVAEDGTYKFKRSKNGDPMIAGIRLLVNHGGGNTVNQHMNSNDLAAMYKAMPLSISSDEAFCMATFDPFLSPSAKYSDFVLPTTIALEVSDWTKVGEQLVYHPPIVKSPGDAKDAWRYTYEALKIQEKLGPHGNITMDHIKKELSKYEDENGNYKTPEVDSLKIVDDARKNPESRFYKMTREEVYEKQYLPRANVKEYATDPNDLNSQAAGRDLRVNLDNYLKGDMSKPFVRFVDNYHTKAFPAKGQGAEVKDIIGGHAALQPGQFGFENGRDARPKQTGRLQVFNDILVWDYENKHSKWHGHLPPERRGQANKDAEGDQLVFPIALHINFQDGFNEAYGTFNGKPENDVNKYNGLTLSTTHDRYRVHSTHTENPLLKEFNHRVAGGGYFSGNDYKEYVTMPETQEMGKTSKIPPMYSNAVAKADPKTASWHEIWINTEDAAERGIGENDLVLVENPIGKVRCVARLTDRCMRGHANLHQGAWYDPNPTDGVDDGGNANTLMAMKPSRIDHGNAQQFAYVKISKTTPPKAII